MRTERKVNFSPGHAYFANNELQQQPAMVGNKMMRQSERELRQSFIIRESGAVARMF